MSNALAGLGAFLSGIGSVLGGLYLIRHLRKRCEEDCLRRMEEVRRAFSEGYRLHEKESP